MPNNSWGLSSILVAWSKDLLQTAIYSGKPPVFESTPLRSFLSSHIRLKVNSQVAGHEATKDCTFLVFFHNHVAIIAYKYMLCPYFAQRQFLSVPK